jgi:hypothetical protein
MASTNATTPSAVIDAGDGDGEEGGGNMMGGMIGLGLVLAVVGSIMWYIRKERLKRLGDESGRKSQNSSWSSKDFKGDQDRADHERKEEEKKRDERRLKDMERMEAGQSTEDVKNAERANDEQRKVSNDCACVVRAAREQSTCASEHRVGGASTCASEHMCGHVRASTCAAEHMCGRAHVRPSTCAAEHMCGRAHVRPCRPQGGFGGSPPHGPRFCPLLPQKSSSAFFFERAHERLTAAAPSSSSEPTRDG